MIETPTYRITRLRRGLYEIRLLGVPEHGCLHWFVGNRRTAVRKAKDLAPSQSRAFPTRVVCE